jgi:antitoxin MazE
MADFLSIQARGTVSLPVALRRKYRLDEPGAQLEVIDADGEIILRPKLPVDASQAWFWGSEWQEGEREAELQAQAGQGDVFASGEDLLATLDSPE